MEQKAREEELAQRQIEKKLQQEREEKEFKDCRVKREIGKKKFDKAELEKQNLQRQLAKAMTDKKAVQLFVASKLDPEIEDNEDQLIDGEQQKRLDNEIEEIRKNLYSMMDEQTKDEFEEEKDEEEEKESYVDFREMDVKYRSAYKNFQAKMLKVLRVEFPSMKLSGLRQRIFKEVSLS